MNQQPSVLLQDNDGHWYLVAESDVDAFETALQLIQDSDDDVMLEGHKALRKVKHISIDSPESLRILAWEDVS